MTTTKITRPILTSSYLLCFFLFLTASAGAQWYEQHYGQFEGSLVDIFFLDKSTGWALNSGGTSYGLLKTIDGGDHWTTIAGTSFFLGHFVWFTDADNGWAGGSTYAWRSTNGGLNWNQTTLQGYPLEYLQFVDNLHGWYSGFDLMRTTDGGQTWTTLQPGGFNFFFTDMNNGFLLIPPMTGNGTIMKTYTGGSSWFTILQDTLPCVAARMYNTSVHVGWLIGPGLNGEGSYILKTTDSWQHFSVQVAGCPYALNDLCFTDSLHGWVVADSGKILFTGDGGMNWEQQESGTGLDLFSVCFADNEHGWIAGDEALVLHTDNAGVGITDTDLPVHHAVLVSPNPASGPVRIAFELERPSNGSIIIYNQQGKPVRLLESLTFHQGKNEQTIDMEGLDGGVYMVFIRTPDRLLSGSFIRVKF